MLRSTFICFPGLSESAEHKLWRAGCLCWKHFRSIGYPLFSEKKSDNILSAIAEANRALTMQRADYFLRRLPDTHKARILPDFAVKIGYLDIETTGLSLQSRTTTAVLYRSGTIYHFVNGRNLFDISEEIAACQLVVTFNGLRFDIPILEKALGMDILVPHLDLLPVMKALGHRGGLKEIEKRLKIERATNQTDGKAATKLWRRYESDGDSQSLRDLPIYNTEDSVVLEQMLNYAFRFSLNGFPTSPPNMFSWKTPDVLTSTDSFLAKMHFNK